jgi:hypothetical protein
MHSISNIAASAALLSALAGAGAALLLSTDATALADALTEADPQGPPPDGSGLPHGPPPVAFEACAGQQENAVCTVSFHDREIRGHCVTDRDGKLFCMPDARPPAPPR